MAGPTTALGRVASCRFDVVTPSGQRFQTVAPPILGWGWQVPPEWDKPVDVFREDFADASPLERAFQLRLAG